MSTNLRQYTKAVYGFDHVIRTVSGNQWEQMSPCEGWNARDLALHAAGVLRMVETAATGTPAPEASGDPAAAWSAARDAVLAALDHDGVLHKVVPTPFGEMPIDGLIGILFVDALTHTWDLARAVGGDERLAPELVAAAHEGMKPLDAAIRGANFFADKVPEAVGDDAQTALLKFLGRKA